MNALFPSMRTRLRRLVRLVILLLALFVTPAAGAPLRVAVGVPALQTLVAGVGGERVETLVLQGGGDPHAFEPSARRIAALADAQLYVLAGLPFETSWVPRLRAINPKLDILDLRQIGGTRMTDDSLTTNHRHGGSPDPHVWTDPVRALQLIAAIEDRLITLDPDGTAHYRERSERVSQDLRALDAEIAPVLAPLRGGVLLVFHPGWGYLADRYGLRQIPIEVGGREPSAAQLQRVMDLARQRGARALFLQPGHGDRLARQVARELSIPVIIADPLAADYFGSIRTLVRALQTAPETP
jgi:zinc transport system substrate-binding protein